MCVWWESDKELVIDVVSVWSRSKPAERGRAVSDFRGWISVIGLGCS